MITPRILRYAIRRNVYCCSPPVAILPRKRDALDHAWNLNLAKASRLVPTHDFALEALCSAPFRRRFRLLRIRRNLRGRAREIPTARAEEGAVGSGLQEKAVFVRHAPEISQGGKKVSMRSLMLFIICCCTRPVRSAKEPCTQGARLPFQPGILALQPPGGSLYTTGRHSFRNKSCFGGGV